MKLKIDFIAPSYTPLEGIEKKTIFCFYEKGMVTDA